MPRLSVVVPVYNAEKYLEECVASVLSQSFGDFELILVNDGSVDTSGAMCERFAAQDSRVKVIHQHNCGHITARMNGVRAAQGDYVLFLDCDDYWFDGLLEKAQSKISSYGCDMLLFRIEKDGEPSFDFFGGERENVSIEEYLRVNLAQTGLNSLPLKIVKRELFDGIDISAFASFRNSEDLLLSLELVSRCGKISYIPDVFYYYRPNPAGVTNSYNPNVLSEFIASRRVLMQKLARYGEVTQADERELNTGFLRRAADTALQISMSSMSIREKLVQYRRISDMPFFSQAMTFADFSRFGAAKNLRLRLLRARLPLLILLTDKVRIRISG